MHLTSNEVQEGAKCKFPNAIPNSVTFVVSVMRNDNALAISS